MDSNADLTALGEEYKMENEEEMQQIDAGSPMQQSPDQSNFNDNYRSPETTDVITQDGHIDTLEDKVESPVSSMESEEAIDSSVQPKEGSLMVHEVEEINAPETSGVTTETDSSEETGEINDESDKNTSEVVEKSKRATVESDEFENVIDHSFGQNEEIQRDETDPVPVDQSRISPTFENERQVEDSENNMPDLNQQNVNHFKTTCVNADTVTDQMSSIADSLSDSDRKVGQESHGSAEDDSQSPRSQEVSSTSVDKDIPKTFDNVSESLDEKVDNRVPINEEKEMPNFTREKDCFKYPASDRFLVSNLDNSQAGTLIDSLGETGLMTASSSVDNFSTTSMKGSSESDSEDDNLDLDLTKSEINQPLLDGLNVESDNVTSSTNNLQETTDNLDVVSPEMQSEMKEIDVDEERQVSSASKQVDEKKMDDELEEVSDEEVEDDQNEVETGGKQGSLSGMEEVSSEEEEDEESAEIEDKKVESGMEEVSEEEEESEAENRSENGVENVSSDEEEDEEKNIAEDKTEESRTVEIKQNGEVVTIDDTGKEDSTIVKELLENMTIKVENVSEDKEETTVKRRKSKDKKERRESAKPKSKSYMKDTRDINERLKAQASYGDDVELDYDDTVHEEGKDKQASDSEGEITSDSSSSDGEIEEEECEEGEIKEPGQRPFVKPKCRFFMRGHCTWGINCRFLHPGVNDKGYYQLIDRPGFNNRPPQTFEEKWEEEEVERTPSPEPPPPPAEPKEETAWERGLRQAKELRRKALERREMETNFEHKKMNLSIEENPEFDKENVDEVEKPAKKSPVKKTPYYDKYEPLSDDEYYDQTPMRLQQKQMEQSWMPGHYENFEVYWSQDQFAPPPHAGTYPPPQPPPGSRFPYQNDQPMRGRERAPLRPSPRRYSLSPPPRQRQRQMRPAPRSPQEMVRREKIRDEGMPSPPLKHPAAAGRGRPKADEWNDPWTRANATRGKSPKKRSRSRGRRRSRRSYSYSSYSSSSYSGSSRSRSSSYSSVSSRSSRSTSLSRSRSPAPRPGVRRGAPAGSQPVRRPSTQMKTNEPPKSSVAVQGRPGRVQEKRPGAVSNSRPTGPQGSPTKAAKGPLTSPSKQPPGRAAGQPVSDVARGRKPPQKIGGPPPQPQRKFQMAVKARDRPLPQSAFSKDKGKPKPGTRRRKTSSSSSRSRSRSRSSSSSSRSSYSSGSSFSRSRSRSSSTSSSGSADSDHLYRNIGAKDNPKPVPAGRGMPDVTKHGRIPAAGQVRPGLKPGETSRPSSVAQAKVVKDPLKVTGQKSNIKLTLIKQNEKPPPGSAPESVSRKRPAEPGTEAPPLKRPNVPNPPKIDKPVKKPEKALPVSPTKAPGRPQPVAKPVAGVPAAAATATVKKKSTVSRREELLKQLKAVEDAIAKKKKKMG